MNNNLTQKELKNFKTRFSNFFKLLPMLPASLWFTVNYLFVQFKTLFMLQAIANTPEISFLPLVMNDSINFKNVNQHS